MDPLKRNQAQHCEFHSPKTGRMPVMTVKARETRSSPFGVGLFLHVSSSIYGLNLSGHNLFGQGQGCIVAPNVETLVWDPNRCKPCFERHFTSMPLGVSMTKGPSGKRRGRGTRAPQNKGGGLHPSDFPSLRKGADSNMHIYI